MNYNFHTKRRKGTPIFSNERSNYRQKCIFFEQTFDFSKKMLYISKKNYTFAAYLHINHRISALLHPISAIV